MKTPIVILHGWGKKGADYKEIQNILEHKNYSVFIPDMPGFGSEKLIKPTMHIDDYVDFVLSYLKKHKVHNAIFIGHSFGGRISAKLAAQYPDVVAKLILTGAPLIKEELSLKKKALIVVSRVGKKILRKISSSNTLFRKAIYVLLGEWDYYKLKPELKETFKAVIAENIAPNLPHIVATTLVLWGGNDAFVPKRIGKSIASIIPNAKYIEVPNASHKLPYEYPEIFAEEVLRFIEKN
jgi:pimeloyl-ACP methyl ester carboxylesterase